MNKHFSLIYAAVTIFLALGVLWSRAESRNGLALRIEPERFSSKWYSLFISGQSATNFVFETSFDLKEWQVLYQAFGWPGTNPVHRVGPSVESRSRQFIRAVPGESLDAIEQRWQENEPTEYTFRLGNEPCLCPGMISGTVRVRSGSIVEVTDAMDNFTSEPIADPEFSQFLTIGQIFEEIRQEFENKSHQVQVTYDQSGLFPAEVFIDRYIGWVDDESRITATEFAVVEP